MFRGSLLATFLSFPCGALQACQDDHSAQAIRLDREQLDNGNWIYHDFAQGVAEAKRSGKPLMVVFR
jgi:hypothetical protein